MKSAEQHWATKFRFRWNQWTIAIAATLFCFYWVNSSWKYNTVDRESGSWQSDLATDAAGYYIYLPGLFHYGFKASNVDPELAKRTGEGFIIHHARDRIITKYTYGVALFELPFYLVAEGVGGWGEEDQFSALHHQCVEFSGVFYWTLALVLLGLALHRLFPAPNWVPVVALLGISFGSNVFYYAFRQPGFSHIYSFFAVSMALFGLIHGVLAGRGGWRTWLFHLACALIILIRPTDAVIVAGLYLWVLLNRHHALIRPAFWASQIITALVLWGPQLIYWRYAYGVWTADSYIYERFDHWLDPQIFKFLFAPKNGWLPYSPVLLLLPFGIAAMWPNNKQTAWLIMGVIAINVYVCSSWHVWDFGCSYGARPMAQYLPLVAIPFWTLLLQNNEKSTRARFSWMPLLVILAFVNYRAALQYESCYFSDDPWNWDQYAWTIVHAFL